MKPLWPILAGTGIVITAVVVVVRDLDRHRGVTSAASFTSEPLPAVRVKHELITVSVPAATAGTPIPKRPAAATVQRATAAEPAERELRDKGLLDKARRALIGDGTHRPEPFPRVRQH